METRFKVGDRVRHEEYGLGKIVHFEGGNPPIGVSFYGKMNGHDCNSNCIDGQGWYCYDPELTLIESASDRTERLLKEVQSTPLTFIPTETESSRAMIADMSSAIRKADALIAKLQKPKP
jgi:hypothetical protein